MFSIPDSGARVHACAPTLGGPGEGAAELAHQLADVGKLLATVASMPEPQP